MGRSPSTSANETLSTTSHMSIPLMVKSKPGDDNDNGGNINDNDGVVVILRLMLSYHDVQLGHWELVGRQNIIIGVSNIVKGIISLYWEYF